MLSVSVSAETNRPVERNKQCRNRPQTWDDILKREMRHLSVNIARSIGWIWMQPNIHSTYYMKRTIIDAQNSFIN